MTSESFPIPKNFPKVVLVLVGMNFQLWWAGKEVSNLRKKIFNKEFMQKNFGELHRKQLNQEIQAQGYPDAGNGVYSQKLSYSDWYRFNILQRIHLNYLQNFNWATLAVVSAGLVKSNYGVGVGVSYIIARLLYSTCYKRQKGALNRGRIAGVALSYLTCLTGVGILLYHLLKK